MLRIYRYNFTFSKMKKLLNILAVLILIATPLAVGSRVFAQTLDDTEVPTMEQIYDAVPFMESVKSDDYEITGDLTETPLTGEELENVQQLGMLFGGGVLFVTIFSGIILYVFFAITQQKVAQKLGFENSWYAWVPILSTIQLFKMGDQNPWLILLSLIPVLGEIAVTIFMIIAFCKIAEKLGHDKLFGLLALVPFGAFIMWGMLAWGKKEVPTTPQTVSLDPSTLVESNPTPTILPLVEEQPEVPPYVDPIPQPTPQATSTPPAPVMPPQM